MMDQSPSRDPCFPGYTQGHMLSHTRSHGSPVAARQLIPMMGPVCIPFSWVCSSPWTPCHQAPQAQGEHGHRVTDPRKTKLQRAPHCCIGYGWWEDTSEPGGPWTLLSLNETDGLKQVTLSTPGLQIVPEGLRLLRWPTLCGLFLPGLFSSSETNQILSMECVSV